MVKIDIDKTPEEEFETELNTINIDNLQVPLPDKTTKEKKKTLKEYSKKLRADALTENITRLKKQKNNLKTLQKEIEINYLYYRGIKQKIKEMFTGRSYLRIGIITSSMDIKFYEKTINPDKTVNIKKKKYIINKKGLCFINGRPSFFYYEGNSNPIRFNPDHKNNIPMVSSATFYSLFQSKIIGEMFTNTSMGKTMMWTFGVLAGIALIAFVTITATGGSLDQAFGNGKTEVLLLIPIQKVRTWLKER